MLQYSDLDVRCYKLHRSMATELEALTIILRMSIQITRAPESLTTSNSRQNDTEAIN